VHRSPSPCARLLGLLVAAPVLLAACSTASREAQVSTSAAPGTTNAEATAPASAEPAGDAQAEEAGPATAAWLDIELTDAASGETFTLASLAGGVVALEPMAIWCSNCKAQQDNVKAAYADIAEAGVTYISLGIDPGEDRGDLARYAQRRGYDWTFVKSPVALSRALNDLFGPQILSPPSTPLIVLDATGEVYTQEWGFHDPDALLGILGQAADA
jgi:hypothetical protein